jgi:hypothetical protein
MAQVETMRVGATEIGAGNTPAHPAERPGAAERRRNRRPGIGSRNDPPPANRRRAVGHGGSGPPQSCRPVGRSRLDRGRRHRDLRAPGRECGVNPWRRRRPGPPRRAELARGPALAQGVCCRDRTSAMGRGWAPGQSWRAGGD